MKNSFKTARLLVNTTYLEKGEKVFILSTYTNKNCVQMVRIARNPNSKWTKATIKLSNLDQTK